MPTREVRQPILGVTPSNLHPLLGDAAEEVQPIPKVVKDEKEAVPAFPDDLRVTPQQPGLQQREIAFGGVHLLPGPIHRIVESERRPFACFLYVGQPCGPYQQVKPVDGRVGLLLWALEHQLEGMDHARGDLG